MSRLAKTQQDNILTFQPPKPTSVFEDVNTPTSTFIQEIFDSRSKNRKPTVETQTTLPKSEEELPFVPSKLQNGLKKRMKKIFMELLSGKKNIFPESKSATSITCKNRGNNQSNQSEDIETTSSTKSCGFSNFSNFHRKMKKSKNSKNSKVIKVPSTSSSINSTPEDDKKKNPLLCPESVPISIPDYIDRFAEWGNITDEVFTVAHIYINRALKKLGDSVTVKHLHKLIAGAILLAHKYIIDDSFWGFEEYGLLSGLRPRDLKKIDKYLLIDVLDFSLYVSEIEYEKSKYYLLAYAMLD